MSCRRRTVCVAGLALVAVLAFPIGDAVAYRVDIATVVNEPARYDQQVVTISGVAGPLRKIRLRGQAVEFVGFLVFDPAGAYVFVIHSGGSAPVSGGRVEVTGKYHGHWNAIEPTTSYTLR